MSSLIKSKVHFLGLSTVSFQRSPIISSHSSWRRHVMKWKSLSMISETGRENDICLDIFISFALLLPLSCAKFCLLLTKSNNCSANESTNKIKIKSHGWRWFIICRHVKERQISLNFFLRNTKLRLRKCPMKSILVFEEHIKKEIASEEKRFLRQRNRSC